MTESSTLLVSTIKSAKVKEPYDCLVKKYKVYNGFTAKKKLKTF